ncbi:MAG: gluconate 2-dehydrogenase subunit 3 family protein, partial [Gammaproteobacteria bacterium SHHR-1]
EERAFLLRGAGWLEDLCVQRLGQGFVHLSNEQQGQMLTEVAQSEAGENWINSHLSYLLEALLSDPIYGGNRDEQGWRWLGHRPGFPRPNRDNCYKAGQS